MRTLIGVLLAIALILVIPPTIKVSHIKSENPVEATKPVARVEKTESKPTHKKAKKKAVAVEVSKSEVKRYANGCNTYDNLFRQYDWNVNVAEAICMAESNGNPYAYSSTRDAGLMQIHLGLYLYGSKIYQPQFNIAKAYQKYQSQGWHAWTTYNTGAYVAFL